MSRFLPVFLAALATVAVAAPTARAASSADECVLFQRTQQASGLVFDVSNNCDKNLSCTLAWTLSCETDSGKVTTTTRQAARFSVDASKSHSETGSATSCTTAGWRIDDVTWSCSQAK